MKDVKSMMQQLLSGGARGTRNSGSSSSSGSLLTPRGRSPRGRSRGSGDSLQSFPLGLLGGSRLSEQNATLADMRRRRSPSYSRSGASDYDPRSRSAKKCDGGEQQVAPIVVVFFGPQVDEQRHDQALPFLGVGLTRKGVVPLTAEIANNPMPFAVWWKRISVFKSLEQWRTTMGSLGIHDPSEFTSAAAIVQILFRHFSSTSVLNSRALQDKHAEVEE